MIYFIQDTTVCHIKIGFTAADDADRRLRELQVGSPTGLVLLATMPGTKDDEHALHERFTLARVHGEWFKPVPELLGFILSGAQESEFQRGYATGVDVEGKARKACQALHPVVEIDRWGGIHPDQIGRTFLIQCPVCGFNCSHHSDRVPHQLGVRGGTRTLSFWGECGHCWTLAFGFHKGEMFMAAARDVPQEEARAAELETPVNPTEPTTARG